MNPDQPSREQIEARITALLLGELPAEEAALLRYTIAQDPDLQYLHDQLQATMGLVREAIKNPHAQASGKTDALKLSAERRQKLLAHFQTPRTDAPQDPLAWLPRIEVPKTLSPVTVVLVLFLVLGFAALIIPPNFVRARSTSKSNAMINNLRQVDAAKNEWALEQHKSGDDTPTVSDLTPYIKLDHEGKVPHVGDESYVLGKVSESPIIATTSGQILTLPGEENTAVKAGSQTFPPGAGVISVTTLGASEGSARSEQNYAHSAASPPVSFGLPNRNAAPTRDLVNAVNPAHYLPEDSSAATVLPLGAAPQTASVTPPPPPPMVTPAPVALAAPVLPPAAPVHTTIELPPNDSAPEVATFNGTLSDNKKTWEHSQGAADHVNLAAKKKAAASLRKSGRYEGFFIPPPESPSTPLIGGQMALAQTEPAAAGEASPTPSSPSTDTSFDSSSIQQDKTKLAQVEYNTSAQDQWELKQPSPASKPSPDATQGFAGGQHAGVNRDFETIDGVSGFAPNRSSGGSGGVDGTPNTVASMRFDDTNGAANSSAPTQLGAPANSGRLAKNEVNSGQFAFDIGQGIPYVASNEPLAWSAAVPNTQPTSPNGDLALYKSLERHIATNQAYVEQLRQQLQITDDPNASSPTPTLDAQELAQINAKRIEEKKVYTEQLAQLHALESIQATNKDKLLDVLPQMVNDGALNGLIAKRDEAMQKFIRATNDHPTGNTQVAGLQSQLAALNSQIDDRVGGAMAGLESKVNSTKAALEEYVTEVDNAKLKDQEEARKNQPYYEAKRELAERLRMAELVYSKLESEKLDSALPENSMVQLTDPAVPPTNQTFMQRLTGQYASNARLKIGNDVTDIQGISGSAALQSYDPYFVQTTFEIIQSPLVLSNVVVALDLQSKWARKNGGEKMSSAEVMAELKKRLTLQPVKNTNLIEIGATSDDPNEAANIANAVALAYKQYRFESRRYLAANGVTNLEALYQKQQSEIALAQAKVESLKPLVASNSTPETVAADLPLRKPAPNAPVPQPEILTRTNNFSTFALNVSDASFKLAEASLQNGKLPDTASIRSEEFINAFDYRDPEAAPDQPMVFASERARYPFAHNRELLRLAVKTAAAGRQTGRALNLVLLLDNSGSMERADRVAVIHEALRVLSTQLQPQDTVSVVTFARTARLWADGVSGDKTSEVFDRVDGITPEGGTNLEEAMRLAYETAHRHYLAGGVNRVVLLTDGAANLGDVDPNALKQKVDAQRKQGIALDCFGIGWEDYNDTMLEQLSSNGGGRYAFLNSPEDVARDFAAKLAGALQIAAADVKVQIEFNPQRVTSYRQIGYATHQLTKQQFRDNTVAAGQIAAQEAGNALYTIETNPNGEGPIATVRVRYQVPGTSEYREHSWNVEYTGGAPALEQSSTAMRLATTASAFSEWLAANPYSQEITPEALLKYLSGVPEIYGADDRPKQLETMIREAKSIEGK